MSIDRLLCIKTLNISMEQNMNDTLNSIFVRLDVSLQNLSSKAIAQIIVKLLYKHDGRMKKQAIYEI